MNQFEFWAYIYERSSCDVLNKAQQSVYKDVLELANWWCTHENATKEEVLGVLEDKVDLYRMLLSVASDVTPK